MHADLSLMDHVFNTFVIDILRPLPPTIRCSPCFRDLSILERPVQRTFKEKKYINFDLRIFYISIIGFLSPMLHLFWFVLKDKTNVLRCDLLFGLIDHFGLYNILIFLFFLSHNISLNLFEAGDCAF